MLYKENKQKGLVLLTGMVFILIVSTAVVASYQSISSFAFGRSYEIEYIKRFYRLEDELLKLENSLINPAFFKHELESLLIEKRILDNRHIKQALFPDALWFEHADFVQSSGELEYIIEYLGKYLGNSELLESEQNHDLSEASQVVYAWTFRIHVQDKKARNYTMQSIVHIYPTEFVLLLQEHNLELHSERIAWFDYTFGE